MNTLIQRDSDRLTAHAERVKQDLQNLGQDCAVWARKREEKDLLDLMEDLKGVQNSVKLMLTDCICTQSQCGDESGKEVFDNLCEILCCLDPLFSLLKKARMQLDEAYIHPVILDRLEIDYGRFRKLVRIVQTHANGQQRRNNIPLEETPLHLAREYAATV
jgi:hypothetical protein